MMDPDCRAPLQLLTCEGARTLANAVSDRLSVPLTPAKEIWFSCGEAKVVIGANVRGCDCYVFQQPVQPESPRSIYDHTMALLHAVDAARCADADRITVVVPYLPGTRQDKRKGRVREGVTTGLLARVLSSAGVDMVITVEPHNEAIYGCYDPSRCVLESVGVTRPFSRFLKDQGLVGDVVASTDVGGLEMARSYAEELGKPIAALSKERDYSRINTVVSTSVIGDVRGRSVLIVDDIVDTAGSVVSAVHSLWEEGATSVIIAAVHMLLSGPAWERLHGLADAARARGVEFRVVGTSSVPHCDPPSWYATFGLEPLIAQVIRSVNNRGSVRAIEQID
ncbi:MAG: ribose-phosphate diphosphokinase [Myxococcota bacterium]